MFEIIAGTIGSITLAVAVIVQMKTKELIDGEMDKHKKEITGIQKEKRELLKKIQELTNEK